MGKSNKEISLFNQAQKLALYYPKGRLVQCSGSLVWQCEIQPGPFSITYVMQIEYQRSKLPTTRIVEPVLKRSAAGKLPHVYDVEKQILCLFYPERNEWTAKDQLALTIVPWTKEWLYYYEHWLITGKWLGGGTHNHDM